MMLALTHFKLLLAAFAVIIAISSQSSEQKLEQYLSDKSKIVQSLMMALRPAADGAKEPSDLIAAQDSVDAESLDLLPKGQRLDVSYEEFLLPDIISDEKAQDIFEAAKANLLLADNRQSSLPQLVHSSRLSKFSDFKGRLLFEEEASSWLKSISGLEVSVDFSI